MKTLILWILVLTIASISNAQNVNIPDTAFLNALIDEGVDTDGDSMISLTEAKAVTYLELDYSMTWGGCISGRNITNFKGIEAFANMDTFICLCNEATSLDITNNTNLKLLNCSGNNLTELDVSSNTALKDLVCWDNQLTNLDVSNNAALTDLNCRGNQLTSLNVSNNTALTNLNCGDNSLTNLDVSKNTDLNILYIENMPNLSEVCVWTLPFPPADVEIDTAGSPNAYFTTDCSITALNPINENSTIDIYPNPANDKISIEIENINNTTIEIYNVSSMLVFSKELNSKVEKIDISGFSEGLYFVKIRQEQNVSIEKLIVY